MFVRQGISVRDILSHIVVLFQPIIPSESYPRDSLTCQTLLFQLIWTFGGLGIWRLGRQGLRKSYNLIHPEVKISFVLPELEDQCVMIEPRTWVISFREEQQQRGMRCAVYSTPISRDEDLFITPLRVTTNSCLPWLVMLSRIVQTSDLFRV